MAYILAAIARSSYCIAGNTVLRVMNRTGRGKKNIVDINELTVHFFI